MLRPLSLALTLSLASASAIFATPALALQLGTTSVSGSSPVLYEGSAASVTTILGNTNIILTRTVGFAYCGGYTYVYACTNGTNNAKSLAFVSENQVFNFNTANNTYCVAVAPPNNIECGNYSGTISTSGGTTYNVTTSSGDTITGFTYVIGN